MTSTDSYSDLCSRMKEIILIEGAAGQLGWDEKSHTERHYEHKNTQNANSRL